MKKKELKKLSKKDLVNLVLDNRKTIKDLMKQVATTDDMNDINCATINKLDKKNRKLKHEASNADDLIKFNDETIGDLDYELSETIEHCNVLRVKNKKLKTVVAEQKKSIEHLDSMLKEESSETEVDKELVEIKKLIKKLGEIIK